MKLLRIAVAAVFATAFGSAYAFHSGGVAECEGCHTMHNTVYRGPTDPVTGVPLKAGAPINNGVGNGAIYLLQGTDQSSACLNCHNSPDVTPSSYHVSTDDSMFTTGLVSYSDTNKAPVEMTPGGDFGWLKVDRIVTVRKNPINVMGHERGHNIVAVDYGYVADTANAEAPGAGARTPYPADKLACSSCHDPHGRYRRFADGSFATTGLPIFNSGSYGSSADPVAGVSAVGAYRILGGSGYLPKSLEALPGVAFTPANPPDAAVNSTYNRSEATAQTHVAYGRGMSEWCANCHSAMLENAYASGQPGHRHPAGNAAKLTTAIIDNYNKYVSSGIMTNADATKAYSTLAPFELGTGDYTKLKPLAINADTGNQAATIDSNVSCLSCHRAHASAFVGMTRYFLENEFMTVADATNAAVYDSNPTENKVNYGLNVAEQTAAYYGRPATKFGPYARNYCNKCHAKD